MMREGSPSGSAGIGKSRSRARGARGSMSWQMSFLIARLPCWLQQLLQPCPSGDGPGVARARRLRTRNAEAPHEPHSLACEGKGYVGMRRSVFGCLARASGRSPLEIQQPENQPQNMVLMAAKLAATVIG